MSILAHAIVITVIAAGALVLAAAGAFFVIRHFVRRRWRRMGGHVAARGVVAALTAVTGWRERVRSRTSVDDLSGGPAVRAQRSMWWAIEDAEEAVRHALSLDAVVAELPAVCQTMRRMGQELDQLLRLERRMPAGVPRSDAVRSQVADVINTARDVQSAALRACTDATKPRIESLLRHARDEVEIANVATSRVGARLWS